MPLHEGEKRRHIRNRWLWSSAGLFRNLHTNSGMAVLWRGHRRSHPQRSTATGAQAGADAMFSPETPIRSWRTDAPPEGKERDQMTPPYTIIPGLPAGLAVIR